MPGAKSFRHWDDRRLLNLVDTVLRRLYRSWGELAPSARGQVDRLRVAAAARAGDSSISAAARREVLATFLEDLASLDSVLPTVDEAAQRGLRGETPASANPKGISYLQVVNLLRLMRDDPSHFAPRAVQAAKRPNGLQPQAGARPANDRAAVPGWQLPAAPVPETVRGAAGIPFYTYVDFPTTISSYSDTKYPLVVQLVRDRPRRSRGEGEVDISFQDEVEFVDVVVRAPAFAEVSGYGEPARDGPALRRTIVVSPEEDSQPAVFLLQLVEGRSGPQWVTVDFYHRGRNAGSLTLEVDIRGFQLLRKRTRRGGTANEEADVAQAALGTATIVRAVEGVTIAHGAALPAADLELRIVRDADGRTLHFHLHSQKVAELDGRAVGSILFNDLSRPDLFFDRLVGRLSDFAARAGEDMQSGEAVRIEEEVADIGVELYEQLFPQQLRKLYWKIKELRESGKLKNLLIVSDEPWIPWELVKPYDVIDGRDMEDDHLAGAWPMSRWLAGVAAPSDLQIEAARLVVPMLDLEFVHKEIQYFDSLAARQIEVAPPVTTRAEFLELAQNGGAQLFHFATHGDFNQTMVDESPIVLQGDPLFPSDLSRRRAKGLRRERPLIFLNICHGARVGYNLTGLGGWAQRLVDHVGVTAFVGALWEVHDELASRFSRLFYEELWAGKTLGDAFFSARQQIRDTQRANPTWLAYTLYGDPNSRVIWKSGRAATLPG